MSKHIGLDKLGLTAEQAREKLASGGFNELPSAKPKTLISIILQVIREPMFMLLISCGALYMMLGDYHEGIILSSSIIVIIAITFYQYRKTQRALEALRQLSSPRALVIRDGKEQRIAGREVVPGDILVLQEGDRVAADGWLLDCRDLLVDESLLTGESVPVNKEAATELEPLKTVGRSEDNRHKEVFSGTMILRGTGYARVLATGSGTSLGKIGLSLHATENTTTRLQAEMKTTIRRLALAGMAISVLVTISFFLTRGNWVKSLLTGLSSAMAILPEEFPVVMTIFLALGAWRLSQRKVLTRDPAAIETLGSATVLCSDKTGTITENRMTVTAWWNDGKIQRLEPGMSLPDNRLALMAGLACPEKAVDPMDKAVLIAAVRAMPVKDQTAKSFRSISFQPFSRETLFITHEVELGSERFSAMKGAPEAVLEMCRLDETSHRIWTDRMIKMASEGLRVLGVAEGKTDGIGYHYSFHGFIGLEDPVRAEVPAAMDECRRAGVRVIMITGDYPVTASSIGERIGLDQGKLLTGDQLEEMDDETLRKAISDTNLFARVVPEQKLRIVRALQANGEVVAMTGDGINDAPALKAANIGIAMGMKGTDVAREASSLVVLDDNFASIVQAIRLGRRIYDNLKKAMMYILAIHIPIIGLSLLPAFIPALPILMFPLHIVFLELIIDPVCSVAFENEPAEPGLMERPPRKVDDKFFGFRHAKAALANGILILFMVLVVYFLSIREGHTDGEVRLIAFSSLILANIGFILSSLSQSRNLFQVLGEHNPAVKIILGSALIVLMLITFLPPFRSLFAFEYPGIQHLIPGLLGGIGIVIILEIRKALWARKVT